MKKFLQVFCIFLMFLNFLSAKCFAQDTEKITTETAKPCCYNYYVVDDINLTMRFTPLLNEELKSLSKEQKKIYKKIVKIEHLLNKDNLKSFNKAYKIEPEFLPTYLAYFHYYKKNQLYKEQAMIIEAIIALNNRCNIIDAKELEINAGFANYTAGNYEKALVYLTPYIKDNLKYSSFVYILSDLNYKTKNYKNAIFYANKIVKDRDYQNNALALLFDSYKDTNDNVNAAKYARELIKLEQSSINYLRLIMTSSDNKEILKYSYKLAENYAKENDYKKALEICHIDIVKLEEEKIKKAIKNIKGFVEVPSWESIFSNDYSYMKFNTAYYRLINFYKSTNDCINKYYGNDLKACFASVNRTQEKITSKLIEEKRAEEQKIAEEQRLKQMQLMNYNIMQQNNLIQQQNYQLSRPRYTNYTTTKYGNTYYTNSYSY